MVSVVPVILTVPVAVPERMRKLLADQHFASSVTTESVFWQQQGWLAATNFTGIEHGSVRRNTTCAEWDILTE
jgi:hypothetical protein